MEMEYWTWPPSYDPAYVPPLDQAYWFPVRETMDPEQRDQAILARIREVMEYAYADAPFYRAKWDQAGIKPTDVRSLQDFEAFPR